MTANLLQMNHASSVMRAAVAADVADDQVHAQAALHAAHAVMTVQTIAAHAVMTVQTIAAHAVTTVQTIAAHAVMTVVMIAAHAVMTARTIVVHAVAVRLAVRAVSLMMSANR